MILKQFAPIIEFNDEGTDKTDFQVSEDMKEKIKNVSEDLRNRIVLRKNFSASYITEFMENIDNKINNFMNINGIKNKEDIDVPDGIINLLSRQIFSKDFNDLNFIENKTIIKIIAMYLYIDD